MSYEYVAYSVMMASVIFFTYVLSMSLEGLMRPLRKLVIIFDLYMVLLFVGSFITLWEQNPNLSNIEPLITSVYQLSIWFVYLFITFYFLSFLHDLLMMVFSWKTKRKEIADREGWSF